MVFRFSSVGPLFVLSLIVLLALSPVADNPDRDMAEAVAQLDSLFERWDHPDRPGCAVGVSHDGRTLLSRAYGMADLEHSVPNTPSTIFEAGSVSKQFAAAAIILLELDGKLALDDDIRTYVPEVPDYGQTITLKHLITHTSGLRDWGSVAAISGWGRSNRTHSHDHVLDIISRQSELNFSPGERYSYSNSGYNLLAVVVERVSDMSFAEFSEKRIFGPLGMTNTQWRDDYRRIIPGRSSAYTAHSDSTFSINRPIEHVHGNGGLLTTVQDLLTWNQALENGRLGGSAFVDAMHRTGVLNGGRDIAYGMGLQHLTALGHPVVQHTGATSGYRAYLSRFPEQQLSVAMLCNTTNVSTGGMGTRVAEVFLEEHVEEDEEERPQGVDVASDKLELKAGLYRNPLNGNPTSLVVEEDMLRIEGGPPLTAVSSSTFQVGSGGRQFVFETTSNADRPIVRVVVDGYEDAALEPVDAFDPTVEELEAFTGIYQSEDAEAELTLSIDEGGLVAERRPGSTFSLRPIYTDTFRTNIGLLRFNRGDGGDITGFRLSQPRVYGMEFERKGP